jgi:response regulator RpfG family c-di-GMP phosphodiesterase
MKQRRTNLIVNEILASIRKAKEAQESILVVDDERGILEVIDEMLAGPNYEVIQAQSLVEADRILKDKEISIVLTDLVLGADSGVDVILHTQKYQPTAKIILMTGKPTIQNAVSVLKTGAFDYLIKPFDMETLKATVKRATDLIRLERENIRLIEIMSFYKISEAMGSEIDPDKLLKLIIDTATREFNADFAALHLIRRDGRISKQKSVCKDINIYEILTKFSQDLAEEVGYKGKPLIVSDQDAYIRTGMRVVKSAICQPLMGKGKILGTLNLIRTKTLHQYTTGQLTTLSLFAAKAAIEIENSKLYQELEDAYFDTVAALSNAIEARDHYTGGHNERVWQITLGIAKGLGWGDDKIKELRMGAMLHDIGKIGVPDAILNKPGPLTPQEFSIMKRHPEVGANMVEKITFLNPALPYILYHHERFDGRGYPIGLRGEDIPIQGRLLAVVDTFDAITSDRPYRKGRSTDQAIIEIQNNAGTQFDPAVVAAFISTIEYLEAAPIESRVGSTSE